MLVESLASYESQVVCVVLLAKEGLKVKPLNRERTVL
jgi:hypothetical protein